MPSTEREAKRRAWLDKVAGVRETLTTHAALAESQGRLATPAVNALRDAGFFNLKLPAELGGAEADPVLQVHVYEALSYVHPSAAWCAAIGAANAALTAPYLSDAGAERLYGRGETPLLASSIYPAGTAMPVAGGYRLSGRWRFASGLHHAEWVTAGATVTREGRAGHVRGGAAPETIQVVLPAEAIRIHENWDVMGLQGTGSCDFSVDDRFVPEALAFTRDPLAPQPRRGGPLYRFGVPGIVTQEHTGFALGVARRALDELVTMATGSRGRFRPSALAERAVVHRFVGTSDLKLRAARALALAHGEEIWQRLCDGEPVGPSHQAQCRALVTYTTDLAVEIATQAFRYGGAGALFRPNILELLLRDMNAAAQHIVAADVNYEIHGRELMGVPERHVESPGGPSPDEGADECSAEPS